jgi:hypothetical protein
MSINKELKLWHLGESILLQVKYVLTQEFQGMTSDAYVHPTCFKLQRVFQELQMNTFPINRPILCIISNSTHLYWASESCKAEPWSVKPSPEGLMFSMEDRKKKCLPTEC